MDDIKKLMMFVILFDMQSNEKDQIISVSRLEKPKYYNDSSKQPFKLKKNTQNSNNKNFKIKK